MSNQQSEQLLPTEELLPVEKVYELPGLVYDSCVKAIQDPYIIGKDEEPLLFHTYHESGGLPGHVENVQQVVKLYIDSVLWKMANNSLSYPDAECDPLGIYAQVKDFANSQSNPPIALTDKEFMGVVDTALNIGAMLHDLGNVANKVDWKVVSQSIGKDKPEGIEAAPEMRSYFMSEPKEEVAEMLSAKMYEGFIHQFAPQLQLTGEAVDLSKKIGSTLILNTKKGVGFKNNFKQLAIIDQMAALFSPQGFKGVWGLMNEWSVNGNKRVHDSPHLQAIYTVDPAFMFEEFILEKVKEYDLEQTEVIKQGFFPQIQEYYDANKGSVPVLGIPNAQADVIEDLPDFLLQRLKLRGEVSQLIWPAVSRPYIQAVFLLPFHEDISKELNHRFQTEASELMARCFWDPTLGIEDFKKVHKSIFY